MYMNMLTYFSEWIFNRTMRYTGVQGYQLGPHDAERRHSLGRLFMHFRRKH